MRFFFTAPRILGIRPGVSFGPEDFRKARSRGASSAMTGGFVYVIGSPSGRHKIGVSRDPIARIAQLQTGSSEKLDFAFIGVAPENGYLAIEAAAHNLLERQRIAGAGEEWFQVPASIAIGAVYEASKRTGEPIQQVSPIMVPEIIRLASQPDAAPPSSVNRILKWILAFSLVILAALVAIAIFVQAPPPH